MSIVKFKLSHALKDLNGKFARILYTQNLDREMVLGSLRNKNFGRNKS
jgi:hypothetical protein